MGQILLKWRIPAAVIFSIAIICAAYLLTHSVENPRTAEASTETALLQAIASKDSDGDGLTDWEEALYGTDPRVIDSKKLGMTDGEAVAGGLIVPKAIADISVAPSSAASMPADGSLPDPAKGGTLTEAFSKNFFSLYLSAKKANGGASLSQSEMTDISSEALNSLSSAVAQAPDFKADRELKFSDSGTPAMKTFAASAELVMKTNTSSAMKSEILYLKDAVENNNSEVLLQLASIAKMYRDSATGIAALLVPRELAASDLALVNAMMRLSEIIGDFARVNTDPLPAMLALQQYSRAAKSLGDAFVDIGNVYVTLGIIMSDRTPGAAFVNLFANAKAKQEAAMKQI